MGKLTKSMAMFNSYVSHYQRVMSSHFLTDSPQIWFFKKIVSKSSQAIGAIACTWGGSSAPVNGCISRSTSLAPGAANFQPNKKWGWRKPKICKKNANAKTQCKTHINQNKCCKFKNANCGTCFWTPAWFTFRGACRICSLGCLVFMHSGSWICLTCNMCKNEFQFGLGFCPCINTWMGT